MALLQLAVRGRDVRSKRSRVLELMESGDELQRRYGWDALRLVFPEEPLAVGDYDPRGPSGECRGRLLALKGPPSHPEVGEGEGRP